MYIMNMNTPANRNATHINKVIDGGSVSERWEAAMSAVDYPVHVLPAYFSYEEEYERAEGTTREGRGTSYYFICTDMNRDGVLNPIASVSERFTPVSTKESYQELYDSLDTIEVKANPSFMFISSDGGFQVLSIDIEDKRMNVTPDDLFLRVNLVTGYDGTTRHKMTMNAVDKNGIQIPMFGDFNLARKHTKNIGKEVFAYGKVMSEIIDNWDKSLTTFKVLCDYDFEKQQMIDFAKQFAVDSGIAERHVDRIVSRLTANDVGSITNETRNNAYKAVTIVSHYVSNDMKDKPQLQERVREKMNKAIEKAYNRLSK